MKVDLDRLWVILHKIDDDNKRVIYADSIAAGCYLHAQGDREAGLKLIRIIFKDLKEMQPADDLGGYFADITGNLGGIECELASAVGARMEFTELFKKMAPALKKA